MTTITLIIALMLVAASFTSLPFASAETQRQVYAFLSVGPNPVGVAQTVTILVFTQPLPTTSMDRFYNLTVTLTKPDSTTQVFGPETSGPLGNYVWYYTPTDVGTYKFVFNFPQQTIGNTTFLAAQSPTVELVVQSDQIEPLPDTPLPTEYWDFPINAQNYLWSGMIGSRLQGGFGGPKPFFEFTRSPKTSHVNWIYRFAFGGLDGGLVGPVAYYEGHEYQSKWGPGLVINNYFYQYGDYGELKGADTPLQAVDIMTGEVVWEKDISVSWGQVWRYDSANQVGLHAFLWGSTGGGFFGGGGPSTWYCYDAFDGELMWTFENATSGTLLMEKDTGNMIQYIFNARNGWIAMWNFTTCLDMNGVITYQSQKEKEQFGVAGGALSNRAGGTYDWSLGIDWNVTIAPAEHSVSVSGIEDGIAVCQTGFMDPLAQQGLVAIYGYSLDPTCPGKIWGPVMFESSYTTSFTMGSGTFVLMDPRTMQYIGFDIYTGLKKWDSDPMTSPWGSYGDLGPIIAYDRLYASCYDGLHCWDINTGTEIFHFTSGNAGIETPYGTWVGRNTGGLYIADHKCYWYTGAWHPTPIMNKGDKLYCVDAMSGTNLWNFSFFGQNALVAQGNLVAMNGYDNQLYCFNRGPTTTTVDVSPKVATTGSTIMIEGTVTDQSPAAKELVESGRFSMVPAIADIDMDPWMEYLYSQQPKPEDITGVPVYLTAIRSDGTEIDLGYVISDKNGQYGRMWTPPAQDTYRIVATFKTTDSYWTSTAETLLGVTGGYSPGAFMEPELTGQPTTTPAAASGISTEVIIVAVVAIAVLIGAASYIALRKRK